MRRLKTDKSPSVGKLYASGPEPRFFPCLTSVVLCLVSCRCHPKQIRCSVIADSPISIHECLQIRAFRRPHIYSDCGSFYNFPVRPAHSANHNSAGRNSRNASGSFLRIFRWRWRSNRGSTAVACPSGAGKRKNDCGEDDGEKQIVVFHGVDFSEQIKAAD